MHFFFRKGLSFTRLLFVFSGNAEGWQGSIEQAQHEKKKNPDNGIAAKTIIDLRMIVFRSNRMAENNGNSLLQWNLCSVASQITEIARM